MNSCLFKIHHRASILQTGCHRDKKVQYLQYRTWAKGIVVFLTFSDSTAISHYNCTDRKDARTDVSIGKIVTVYVRHETNLTLLTKKINFQPYSNRTTLLFCKISIIIIIIKCLWTIDNCQRFLIFFIIWLKYSFIYHSKFVWMLQVFFKSILSTMRHDRLKLFCLFISIRPKYVNFSQKSIFLNPLEYYRKYTAMCCYLEYHSLY